MHTPLPATLMPTYNRLDHAFVRGEGCFLFDENGHRYIDALAGIGVVGLGHSHPAVVKTLQAQAATLVHTSNIYRIPAQEKLADKLVEISSMENCFFSNSGAEANEAAIKIARLFGKQKGIEEASIIVMENAFHGRTIATLSATANRKVQAGFEPLVPGFIRVPFNDAQAVEEVMKRNKNVVAVLLEPVQGEGGIHIADSHYLEALKHLCEHYQCLLMFDEVQSGNGRTGKYFAFQHTHIKPDVLTSAKGLGNGFPIGVCLAAGLATHVLKPGNHGSTYGGNHLACAVALEVVNIISQPAFLAQVTQMGQRFHQLLTQTLGDLPIVNSIRHHGLMIGIELKQDCPGLVKKALDAGLLINVTSGNVIRLLPPLVIEESLVEDIVSRLKVLVTELV